MELNKTILEKNLSKNVSNLVWYQNISEFNFLFLLELMDKELFYFNMFYLFIKNIVLVKSYYSLIVAWNNH